MGNFILNLKLSFNLPDKDDAKSKVIDAIQEYLDAVRRGDMGNDSHEVFGCTNRAIIITDAKTKDDAGNIAL